MYVIKLYKIKGYPYHFYFCLGLISLIVQEDIATYHINYNLHSWGH